MFVQQDNMIYYLTFTFFPISSFGIKNCEHLSNSVTFLWSKNVTVLTPARIIFLAISAPKPSSPIKRTFAARNLKS